MVRWSIIFVIYSATLQSACQRVERWHWYCVVKRILTLHFTETTNRCSMKCFTPKPINNPIINKARPELSREKSLMAKSIGLFTVPPDFERIFFVIYGFSFLLTFSTAFFSQLEVFRWNWYAVMSEVTTEPCCVFCWSERCSVRTRDAVSESETARCLRSDRVVEF